MISNSRSRIATRLALGAGSQALAAALALAAFAAPAHAQDAAAGQTDAQDEEITVTGIRASIASSVAQKRESTSIVEVITAEDIGKLPDQSIAESLSRLPGLATQRLDGRANVVSIRGLAPDFTTTLLNGREQVTTNNNRGVELDQYPSELLNGAVVYKTPDASLIGQALGGTIDLKTARPLSYKGTTIAIGARGEINDLGELNPDISNKGYRANISYIGQNKAGTLGWAIGYARMVSPTAEERWQAWGYPTYSDGNLVIGGAKPYVKSNKLTRDGVMGVLEYQPDDQLHVTLDGYWSKFNDEQRLRGLELPFAWGGQGETLQPGYTVTNGLITQGTWTNVKAVMRNDIVHRDANILAGGLNVAYNPSDTLTLEADASYSRLRKTEENIEIYAGTGRGAANGVRDTMGFEVDSSGVIRFSPTLDYSDTALFQLTDPRGWCGRPGFPGNCQDGFINAPRVKDQLASLRLQATQQLGDGNSSIRVGANYSQRTKSLDDEGYVLTHENYPANTPIPQEYLYDPVSLDFIGIPSMLAFNSAKYLDDGHYTRTAESEWTPGRYTNSFEITEKVLTGYLQLNVDAGAVRGNVGVQVVHTDQQGDGYSASNQNGATVVEPNQDGDKYTDVLPSMNLTFEAAPSTFVRFGAARVLARARMDQMNPGVGFSYDASKAGNVGINASPWSATNGNAKLRPLIADSVDVALETYFGRGGYFSVSGFYKYLESFIYRQNDVFDFTGYPYTSPAAPLEWRGIVSQWRNAGGGTVYGAEAAGSLPFATLSSALDGFGVLASGTYTRSRVKLGGAPTTLPGLSEWVVNSTAYYEKNGFQARVSGRYRSAFLAEVQGLSLVRDLVSAKGEFLVDAQVSYQFQGGALKGLSILASGSNLTNEPFITYQNGDELQIRDHQNYGRNFMLGFSYKF